MTAIAGPVPIQTAYRTIRTPIPHPEMASIMQRLGSVESRSMHGQLPVLWDRAQGCTVFDPWGNRWIDFTSTIFVANSGHGNEHIIDAVTATAQKPLLHAYNYATQERLRYLEKLIDATPANMEKAFLVSAGTEAVEVALKLMRMEAQRLGKRRSIVISFEGNWHGRTMGAQHLSSNTAQRAWIGHEDPNVLRLPFPYPWVAEADEDPVNFLRAHLYSALAEAEATMADDVAGFFLETYQGWGAVFYPPAFVQEIERIARNGNALLVFDEMQAGFARTGTLFGYEHYGVTPDLICCGKGASSSLPLAFVLGRGDLLDLPEVGSMSSTHSANPISCAAGLANLEQILDNDLVGRARELGERFHRALGIIASSAGSIRCIEGKGMVAALIFDDFGEKSSAEVATEISEECMRRGLLVVHTGRESIKLAPPITIPVEALDEGLEVLAQVIKDIESLANG